MLDSSSYILAPSLLAANFMNLGQESQAVLEAGADWLHFDVMDGHFVPNLSFGLPVLKSLRNAFPKAIIDAHLMIANPDTFAPEYASTGASIVTFHPEAAYHPHRTLHEIRNQGAYAGIVLNPSTPLTYVEELIHDLDIVLVMSVNPGFGGQSFIPSTLKKIARLKALRQKYQATFVIEVDGGISGANIASIAKAGATAFVAGSAVFKTQNYQETLDNMRAALPPLS